MVRACGGISLNVYGVSAYDGRQYDTVWCCLAPLLVFQLLNACLTIKKKKENIINFTFAAPHKSIFSMLINHYTVQQREKIIVQFLLHIEFLEH